MRATAGVAALLAALLLASVGGAPLEPGAKSAHSLKPRVVEDHISYGKARRRQMARYSRRHYGGWAWKLRFKPVIVLHYTAGGSYSGAWNTFNSNTASRGELPGVCAHYIVGKGGAIREVVPPTVRCRHAIGINHRSLGIEMVQEGGRGPRWAARKILQRRPQIRAVLRLVRWLRAKFDIRLRNVIGHAMADGSPYFKDRRGWSNDHVDWQRREVKEFRRRLRRIT